ncbi:hypothetical protein BKA64DRAFT_197060 [Cadophora sp. MPI-SDFR-AT-0126]|nr:hypothetical protein BKA64DRAFT_197060 [Leotiomycetes sp. MPI-SDFR-AT-0126]
MCNRVFWRFVVFGRLVWIPASSALLRWCGFGSHRVERSGQSLTTCDKTDEMGFHGLSVLRIILYTFMLRVGWLVALPMNALPTHIFHKLSKCGLPRCATTASEEGGSALKSDRKAHLAAKLIAGIAFR